ncbi:hypothetical protein [Dongia sp.]|uniref:hypothetical protein n=1 Tax=Dongia sp. TaxID=1977262 RepID=UPI0035B242BC
MSSLNNLELAMLTHAALSPRPTKTWADRKREQRAKAQARTPTGKLLVNANTIDRALLDAMAHLMRSANSNEPLATVVELASHRFPIPAVARLAIEARLMNRKQKVRS